MDMTLARFEHEWQRGDRDLARSIARDWIASAHPRLRELLRQYSLEGLVRLVSAYRAAGQEEDMIIAKMWILVEYPPQNITGQFDIKLPGVRQLRGVGSHGDLHD